MPNQELTINDSLLEELEQDSTPLPEGYDEDADAYAPPPPVPDGEYLVELSLAGLKANEELGEEGDRVEARLVKWTGDQAPKGYLWIPIQGKILDPGGRQDGKFVNDPMLRSRADRDGRNPVDAIYRAITGKNAPGASEAAKGAALVKELRNKPTCRVTVQLQGEVRDYRDAYKEAKAIDAIPDDWKKPDKYRVRGEKNFDSDGTKLVDTPIGSEVVVGRAVITRYKAK